LEKDIADIFEKKLRWLKWMAQMPGIIHHGAAEGNRENDQDERASIADPGGAFAVSGAGFSACCQVYLLDGSALLT